MTDEDELSLADRAMLYRQGWRDGAAQKTERPRHKHYRAYMRGREDGFDAFCEAQSAERDRLGIGPPSILKGTE